MHDRCNPGDASRSSRDESSTYPGAQPARRGAWHWVFTIIVWEDDGPHATNPIGFTRGMWLATWVFQVMPVFFYVGGYGHLGRGRVAGQRRQHLVSSSGCGSSGLAIPRSRLLGCGS